MKTDVSPGSAVGAIGRTLLRRHGHQGPILVVDDEAPLQQAMAAALRAKGHSVLCAANGSDALELTAIHAPSLVILDLQMPVLDGRGFVQALRRRGHEVPILVITGGLEAARAVDEMGAIGYLEKPFRLGELLHAVSQFGPTPDAATHTPL